MTRDVTVITGGKLDDSKEWLYVGSSLDDRAVAALKEEGAELISSRDIAMGRMNAAGSGGLSNEETYVGECIMYIPGANPLLIRDQLLFDEENITEAMRAFNEGKHWFPEEGLVNKYVGRAKSDREKSILERDVLQVSNSSMRMVSVGSLNTDEVTAFLFNDQVQQYASFLQANGVEKVALRLYSKGDVDVQQGPFVKQVCIGPLDRDHGKTYISLGKNVDYYGVVGVRDIRAE